MSERLAPSEGLGVLHLFCKIRPGTDAEAVVAAVKSGRDDEHQAVCFSVFGHKADLGVLALGPDWVRLRRLQARLQAAGLDVVDSYVSLTEVSEYARASVEKQKLSPRLYPKLPPEGKRAFCFYPMSKRRGEQDNWFRLDFDQRRDLMLEHGTSGRRFAGRVLQLVTGSAGLDDYEWGVTLFAVHPDDLKECVYTMRFDEASARYAEFGPFYAGIVGEVEEVVAQVGLA
ncbi:MAG TPA: chlorite dismutase family protein [Acidimicrobiales bacterium]|nr:chlorite dismutase family protein [Acidimicrobiales bacterium]